VPVDTPPKNEPVPNHRWLSRRRLVAAAAGALVILAGTYAGIASLGGNAGHPNVATRPPASATPPPPATGQAPPAAPARPPVNRPAVVAPVVITDTETVTVTPSPTSRAEQTRTKKPKKPKKPKKSRPVHP
jgi:hypothetical protein